MAKKLDPIVKEQRRLARKAISDAKLRTYQEGVEQRKSLRLANKLAKLAEQTRKRELNKLETEAKITARLQAQLRKYHWLWLHAHEISSLELNVHARDLASALYDLPVIYTGHVSLAMLEQGGQRTREHFHPRQWAGHVIMEYIFFNRGIDMETLRKFADVFRQVHHTTADENNKLRPHQLPGKFETWERSYEAAGVILVQERDTGPIANIHDFWTPVSI